MDPEKQTDAGRPRNPTGFERASDVELVVTRQFDAPARLVYRAWTTPDLLMQWWAPKSIGIAFIACEVDARPGGAYRFVFSHPSSEQPMVFFGVYLEASPPSRLVWTNEEAGEAGAVTTATFEERNGKTLVTLRDRYPSKEAVEKAIVSGSVAGFDESFEQLDDFLADRTS